MTIPDQIVLATDFSHASTAAVPVADKLARLFKVKVTILHVFQYAPRHRHQIPMEWMVGIIRRDVRCRLVATKQRLIDLGVQTEVGMEDGIPFRRIFTFIQSCQARLLVTGTHAIEGVDHFFLGSTAEEVLRAASCPVVTVGPHVTLPTGNDHYFQKILYATDFSAASLGAIPLLIAFRQSFAASVRVLHVSTDSSSPMTSEDARFDLVRKALTAKGDEEYVTLHGRDVCQAVTNEAERYPADLLVLGVRRSSEVAAHLAPKTAFQIIAAAPCAVLTVSS
jgi:nucleotide-binding universal stress UspA family protein